MARAPIRLVTPRDLEILAALQRCPLTALQLLKLGRTFSIPFTDERRVRERLQIQCDAGWVCRWQYATAGRGAPNYYTLTRVGFQLLHGDDGLSPAKGIVGPVGISRQHHTFSLAEFIVHTAVAAHRAGIKFTGFYRENSMKLQVGEDCLYPDAAFQLITPTGGEFSFFVELDNSTERIRSGKDLDSWERKIRLYDRLQDQCRKRFRVLVVTTRSPERLTHILSAAGELLRNPDRTLFSGITLQDYLAEADAVNAPCFRNHRGWKVSLITKLRPNRRPPAAPAESPKKLAETLLEHTWTLCTGFELFGYLFLNDSTSEDDPQEYAVVKIGKDGEPYRQIESVTFSWCKYSEAIGHILLAISGELDDEGTPVYPQIEAVDEHSRCPNCA